MRALTAQSYGSLDGMSVQSLPDPSPGRGEIRVRVRTSALNPADYKVILGTLKIVHGRKFPMVVGYDFSGAVDQIGPGVEDLKSGDEVFGFLPYDPFSQRGAFAEYVVAKADEVAVKPAGVSHEQAAAVATPGATALQSLRDIGRLPASSGRLLVTGVSGGVGSLAVSIAKRLGANVTAVGSGRGLDWAKEQGADRVIDRKSADVFAEAKGPFDLVFDAAVAYRWRQWKRHLVPGGAYVTTLLSWNLAVDKLASLASRTRVGFIAVKSKRGDLERLARWLASGMKVAVDSTIPVKDVPAGLARLKKGPVLGRIVVDVLNGF